MNETEVSTLDKVIGLDWRLWCRLCAKEDSQNINIFFEDEQFTTQNSKNIIRSSKSATGCESNLSDVIHKYFNVKIKNNDQLPQLLCSECFSLVTSLVNFVERVEKVQVMYNDLQKSTVWDFHEFRMKYGLLDDDRQQVFMHQTLPEVHYLEKKPNINTLEERVYGESTLDNRCHNEQPRIADKIKTEFLPEYVPQSEETNTYELEDDNDDLIDPFGGDNDNVQDTNSTVSDGEDDDNTNLATLQITLNAMRKSTNEELNQRTHIHRKKRKSQLKLVKDKNTIDTHDKEEDQTILEPNDLQKSFNFKCSECPQRFQRIQNYRIHMKRKHNSSYSLPQHRCNQCSSVFKTHYKLKRHLTSHLPLNEKRVNPCPYCERKFTTKSFVAKHIKFVHLDEREFICEECGYAVRTSAALRDHMLIHTDCTPFECDVCHKGFKNQYRLKTHKEMHDENKHICAECGLQLSSRATLNRHLLVHSDKMHHKCDYCGRAFKRAKTLKNHLILHTGLKPYSCEFCDLTFANGSNCRTHKKKAHPKELAELEASGGKAYTKNIPKIEALKAVCSTKAADNLLPVVSKQSGNFSLGRKPKLAPCDAGTVRTKPRNTHKQPRGISDTNDKSEGGNDNGTGVGDNYVMPTINNFYNLMQQKNVQMEPPTNSSL